MWLSELVGARPMSVFLIIVGVLGILVSIYNLYDGALYIARQWRCGGEASVHPDTVWQLNASPALATILLFVVKHWVFAVALVFPIMQMLLMALPSTQRGEMPSGFQMVFPQVGGFLGRAIIVLGAAIVLTLSLTGRNGSDPTLLSWYLPVLLVAFVGVTWAARLVFGWLIGVLAILISR